MKDQEFEFIVDVPPDEDTIRRFYRSIAQGLINKYGVENMRRVLEEFKKQGEGIL